MSEEEVGMDAETIIFSTIIYCEPWAVILVIVFTLTMSHQWITKSSKAGV